ncbi:MAG: arylesterase [Vibrio sp.]
MVKRLSFLFIAIVVSLVTSITYASEQNSHTNAEKVQQNNSLLILGDSLSAGYQMGIEQSWPYLLGQDLKQSAQIEVINASISGDTSGNGLARLPQLLQTHNPKWLLIELGANDGLRGFAPQEVEKNLNAMIELAQSHHINVILMQIKMPPNYGRRYTEAFAAVYPKVAQSHQIPLIDFFLEEVILKQEWMKQDGLHPNEKAQPWISEHMKTALTPYLGLSQIKG